PGQPAATARPPVAPGQTVHGRRRADVAAPGDDEHAPRAQPPPARKKGSERLGGIRGHGWKDALQRGEPGDRRVEEAWGEGVEKAKQGHCKTATAITASPSPFPIHPIPSLLFPFTETAPA